MPIKKWKASVFISFTAFILYAIRTYIKPYALETPTLQKLVKITNKKTGFSWTYTLFNTTIYNFKPTPCCLDAAPKQNLANEITVRPQFPFLSTLHYKQLLLVVSSATTEIWISTTENVCNSKSAVGGLIWFRLQCGIIQTARGFNRLSDKSWIKFPFTSTEYYKENCN